ncbi:hypothetical protein J3U96_04420 [Stenotrophomonas maltophilia]|nr:hypothetical protein J3U96_04420 [Stenotrophomonas maltophilia]
MASVGFVPTKVGTYQSNVVVSVGFVPTKVGTYQSNVMASVGFVPTKVGTYQSNVMASVGFVPTKVGTYQSNVTASAGFVPTKVGTYQSRSWQRRESCRPRSTPTRTSHDIRTARYQSARRPMLPSMMRRFSLRSPPSSRV